MLFGFMSFACLAFWADICINKQCCKGTWLHPEGMTLVLVVQCSLKITQGLTITVLKPVLDSSTQCGFGMDWHGIPLFCLSHQNTVMLKQAQGKDLRQLVILSSSVTSCLASTEKNIILSLHFIWEIRICHWGKERGIKKYILL